MQNPIGGGGHRPVVIVVNKAGSIMRIAQVAPLAERVPPFLYGGTERVVSYLTEELVRRGHEVTLFASGDSETTARLVSPCEKALWRSNDYVVPDVYYTIQIEQVAREAENFDVIHFHFDHQHLPLLRRLNVPYVTTMHGRLDLPDLVPLYKAFPDTPVISISDAQREPLPWLNWQRTIHHGLPLDLYDFYEGPRNYLAFLGRVSPEKGLDRAIEIAKRAGLPLKISANVHPVNRAYFEQVIRPLMDHPLIEFLGELGGKEKEEFLGGALAVLFPIDWPEPFGLVMIESMATGTPVIANRRGSVPEVVKDGVSGFIVDTVDEAVKAIERIPDLDRRKVRQYFEERFSVERMVDEHLETYHDLIAKYRPVERRKTRVHAVMRGWTPLQAPVWHDGKPSSAAKPVGHFAKPAGHKKLDEDSRGTTAFTASG